ncbi:hypothetical protein ACWCHM_11470 [Micromonospora sp. SCSIO 07396]
MVVNNVPVAYGRLARAVVDRLPATTLIGVTGSVGNTSTKDVLAQVLPGWGATVATPASNSNELGCRKAANSAGLLALASRLIEEFGSVTA